MTPGGDQGRAGPQGAQDHGLAELPFDACHGRVGDAPLHVRVADDIPLGIAQGGEEPGAVSDRDGVARWSDGDGRDRPWFAGRRRVYR